jgi:aspartyl-tRNA(Asn)/glutamyl-tRNA(Gln) amidotransferase subunit C
MALTRQQVLHVAGLARLELTDTEVSSLEIDLSRILEHVDTLAALDTTGVEATEYVSVQQMPFRPDIPEVGVNHAAALAPSPRVLAGSFAVPAFIDD